MNPYGEIEHLLRTGNLPGSKLRQMLQNCETVDEVFTVVEKLRVAWKEQYDAAKNPKKFPLKGAESQPVYRSSGDSGPEVCMPRHPQGVFIDPEGDVVVGVPRQAYLTPFENPVKATFDDGDDSQ